MESPKIFFPSFDDSNPRYYVRKCKKFFNIHPMDDKQKLDMVSMHVEGRVDVWLHDYQESHLTTTGDQFVIDLCNRFQEEGHENIMREFGKLTQKGTIEEYQSNFEELQAFMAANYRTLNEAYFISCFISGLKEDITKMVLLVCPTTLSQAYYKAKYKKASLILPAKELNPYLNPINMGVPLIPLVPKIIHPLNLTHNLLSRQPRALVLNPP